MTFTIGEGSLIASALFILGQALVAIRQNARNDQQIKTLVDSLNRLSVDKEHAHEQLHNRINRVEERQSEHGQELARLGATLRGHRRVSREDEN